MHACGCVLSHSPTPPYHSNIFFYFLIKASLADLPSDLGTRNEAM